MLKPLLRAGAVFALLVSPQLHAQTAVPPAPAAAAASTTLKPAHPALWVVKDKDTTIYLFGTIHVLKPGIGWFDKGVKAAFDKSGQVMLELVQPDAATLQSMMIRMAFNPSGPTVTELLPADKRDAYAAAFKDLGLPSATFDRFDPWVPAITLSVAPLTKLGWDPNSGAEQVITAAAKAANKPVAGLETAEQQLGYFDALPQPLQIKFLVSTVDSLPKLAPTLDKMVDYWSAGRPDALGKLLNEDMDDTPEIGRILLTERNQRWAKWIEERLKTPGTVFIAVGAGHLAGSDSVQSFLAKDHVKAKRVKY